jgi:4-hydroxy-3-methylbut-2-enyl diphosphate reductase IspH
VRLGAQRVEERARYAAEGFTSVIHGKYWHEETRATASQALNGGEASI